MVFVCLLLILTIFSGQTLASCAFESCQNGGSCISDVCICPIGWAGLHCDTEINICQSNPCKNGGMCSSKSGEIVCTCQHGYSGPICEFEVHPCFSSPCFNNATCVNYTIGGHGVSECHCRKNFYGHLCQADHDICQSNPCINGKCLNIGDGYRFYCLCNEGYGGKTCMNPESMSPSKMCEPNPCINGGTCNLHGQYREIRCSCPHGWTGSNCEYEMVPCIYNPCLNNGSCVNYTIGFSGFHYECRCPKNFYGTLCERDFDVCESNPCTNDGTCVNWLGSYVCHCPKGENTPNGRGCKSTVNELSGICASNPCQNGASCRNFNGSYQCNCLAGFVGPNCENDVDECASAPCRNSGTCSDQINAYYCYCPVGFSGKNCQTDINECLSEPCLHDGTCFNKIGGYRCACRPGYTGYNCHTDIDECQSYPCSNSSICKNMENQFRCVCLPGVTGVFCDKELNECQSNPCKNGGLCHDMGDMYNCTCQPGYIGFNCEFAISSTPSYPINNNVSDATLPPLNTTCPMGWCYNGGSCMGYGQTGYSTHNFLCVCPLGYAGMQCEISLISKTKKYEKMIYQLTDNINITKELDKVLKTIIEKPDLLALVTKTKSVQEVMASMFKDMEKETVEAISKSVTAIQNLQNVKDKFSPVNSDKSKTLATTIDYCASNPCLNAATCQSHVLGRWTCDCRPGFTGQACEHDIDECQSSPCNSKDNNSTCTDLVNSYSCKCSSAWAHVHCDMKIDQWNKAVEYAKSKGISVEKLNTLVLNPNGTLAGLDNLQPDHIKKRASSFYVTTTLFLFSILIFS